MMKHVYKIIINFTLFWALQAQASTFERIIISDINESDKLLEIKQSLPQLSLEQLVANSKNPQKILVKNDSSLVTMQDFERLLLPKTQLPSDEEDNAMRSLSYYVSQSLLNQCAQLCGLQIKPEMAQGMGGQLMNFSCDNQMVSLREYLSNNGSHGFSLSKEQINLLVNQQPAWLQRIKHEDGSSASFLAWEGTDRGYSLYTASASDEAIKYLVDLANSLSDTSGESL